jgi:hypothetical protein
MVTVVKAPIVPDGTTAGAVTDIVVSFLDPDPAVDGIGIATGGTISVDLPAGFVRTDAEAANVAIILQGWQASPAAPPPAFIWTTAVSGNTVTATLTADFLVGAFGPGPKQIHLRLTGFRNPPPGRYALDLAIRPDPGSAVTMNGTGTVQIIPQTVPSLNSVSVVNGAPPPPFPNPVYQTVAAGDDPLLFGFYLWNATGAPLLGVDIQRQSATQYRLVDAGGTNIGAIVIDAPTGASTIDLVSQGPSVEVPAFVSTVPTGLLRAQLEPDPNVTGTYTVTFRLDDGAPPISIGRGLTEFVFPGPDAPIASVIASIAGAVDVVWHWDNAAQSWSSYRPGFGFLSDLDRMHGGDIYWIGATTSASLITGSVQTMFVTVEG